MEEYFKFKENGTDFKTEVIAGITTFLSGAYIVVVNPSIISNTGMPFSGVLTATVIVSAFSSIMMGVYANNPILLAPGMGLNAFFTFYIVNATGIRWETALGAVFWSGIVFLLLSVFNIRSYILKAIPGQIRYAIAAGIGLFISMIGFINAEFIVANKATIIGFGGINSITLTFAAGLFFTSILVVRRIKGALILGMAFTTFLSVPVGRIWGDATQFFGSPSLVSWKGFFALPDFSLFLKMDLIGSMKFAMWPVIFAFLFTDMFDSISTFIGIAEAGDLLDEDGEPKNIRQSLIVDSISTVISGIFGTSPGTSYIESAAGVEQGGRTGLTAVVAGLLFLPLILFSPLLSMIPSIATAPAMVVVGVFMMRPVMKINWYSLDDAIPSFLALILIPATYSITQGIIWGFLSWTVIKALTGKKSEVSPMLIAIDIFAIASLII